MLILAGCGGGGVETVPTAQKVSGPGYRFEAPPGWKVTHAKDVSAATDGAVDRVEVRTFKLVRPYEVSRFKAATRELDGVITRIAAQLNGKVVTRRTVRVGGRKARSYTVVYDGRVQQITFVLAGRREHQLSCRRLASSDDAACRALLASFALR